MNTTFDVCVAGAGVAGLVAAVAAARHGAKTVIVERNGWVGGLGVGGATGLHNFFNIYNAHENAVPMKVAHGIAQEIVDRCTAAGGGMGHLPLDRGAHFISMITIVDPEVFKLVGLQMLKEAGVEILFSTVVTGAKRSGHSLKEVGIYNKAGNSSISARVFVDTTGDGDLSAHAGVPFEHFVPGQPGAYPAGYNFRLCNVDLKKMEASLAEKAELWQLGYGIKPGMTSPDLVRFGVNLKAMVDAGCEGAPHHFFGTSIRPREVTHCNCLNYHGYNSLDPRESAAMEIYLREQTFVSAEFFKKHIDGCQDSYVCATAAAGGQRRGRSVHGVYELTETDCVEGQQFDDQIGCFSFIDNGTHLVKDGGAYGIPYRALVTQECDNLLMAGRLMTIDTVAHNSTRNTVCCMICGQAAGTAAAILCQQKAPATELPVPELQERLRSDGAYLTPVPVDLATFRSQ